MGVVFEAEGPVLSSIWDMEDAVEIRDPHLMLFGNVGLDQLEKTSPRLEPLVE